MRRHRAAIGVIGAVTLVSLIAAVLLGIAWRRAADAERLASERATRLADALIASDVDRARLSELGGQLAIAEALAWNVKLSMPPPHDDEVGEDDALAEQAHWILRAVYDASPCTASLQFPAGMQPATIRFSEDGRQMQVLSIAGVVSRWNGPGTDIVVEEPIPGERRIPQRSSRDGWALFREGSAEFMGRDGRRHRIAMPPLASEAQRCAADDHVRAVALILDDGTALFVDHAGKEMIRVNGELPAMRLAISPGGRYGAVGPQSGPCRVFELATRREIGLIGSWRSTSLRFSPDDRFVAILDANVINICELPSLEVVKTLVGAATWISDVTWSSTGTRLASVGWDRQATVWDVENERPLVRLAGLTDVGVCVAFDPGDSRLAAMDRSGTLRLFKVEPPAPMRMIPFESCAPFSLALGAAPGEIAVGAENGDVLWRLPGGTPQRWRAHDGVTSAIAFLPDHAGLVTSGYDGDVRAWTPGGELRWSTEVGDLINHLIVAADRSHVIVSKQSGEVLWLRLPDGRPARAVLAHSGRSIRVGQDPRGQWVLSGGSDGRLMRIDGSSSVAVEIDRFTGAIRALAVDPTGRFVAAAGDDREIRVYETQSWTIASVLAQHEASIFALAFDGAGHTLASGDAEGFIRLSRGPRWADVGGWREHDSMCFDLGLDASGRTLFSISRDASLLVRALDTADECIAGNLGYRAARAAAQGRDVPALAAHEAWAIDVLRRGP